MKISYAHIDQTPQVRQLWKAVFGDTEGFLDLYFAKVYKPENTLVLYNESKLCASLQMIPYVLVQDGQSIPTLYIYAVMTAEDERGKGYMANLLDFAFDEMRTNGIAFTFLIPQEEYLFDVYCKFGFKKAFQIQAHKFLTSFSSESVLIEPTIAEAYNYYLSYNNTRDYIQLSYSQFEFVCESAISENGSIIALKADNAIVGISIQSFTNDNLNFLDVMADNEQCQNKLLFLLANKYSLPVEDLDIFHNNKSASYLGMIKLLDTNSLSLTDFDSVRISLMMND